MQKRLFSFLATFIAIISVSLPQSLLAADSCADAPTVTTADLFVSTGKPFLWENPGDQVRGKTTKPSLAKLQFTSDEQAVFLKKIAEQDGELLYLKKGDVLGLMATGAGKLQTNTTVQFSNTDTQMRVYSHQQVVRLNGACSVRELVLLELSVGDHFSRISDLIYPVPKKEAK